MRILRVVRSQSLACGCFVGFYETYAGRTVAIVEEPGANCRCKGHGRGSALQPPDRVVRPAAASNG